MLINRNQFVTAISVALDFLEKGIRDNVTFHNKRVGLIALKLGQAMGLDNNMLFDLSAYAMLHDNGITHEVYNIMADNGVSRLENSLSHCINGEMNIEAFPFLEKRKNIIKYHHEFYDGSGRFGVAGDNIPLFSQIIAMADLVEVEYQAGISSDEIISHITKASGNRFSLPLSKTFLSMAKIPSFWLSLDNMFVEDELAKAVPVLAVDMDYPQLLETANIVRKIIDAKSPFTGSHSKGLSEKAAVMADYYGFDHEKKIKFQIAANLHDAGKLVIPNNILDKPSKLTLAEFAVIKAHTFYTRKILESINGFEDICEWASNHHEKLDGTGYPYAMPCGKLDFQAQLMACLDIYQALTENRPYREGLTHDRTLTLMRGMAKNEAISIDITEDIAAYGRDNFIL